MNITTNAQYIDELIFSVGYKNIIISKSKNTVIEINTQFNHTMYESTEELYIIIDNVKHILTRIIKGKFDYNILIYNNDGTTEIIKNKTEFENKVKLFLLNKYKDII